MASGADWHSDVIGFHLWSPQLGAAAFCEAAPHVKPVATCRPFLLQLSRPARGAAQPSVRARQGGRWASAHRGGAMERAAPTKRRSCPTIISCDALAAPDSVISIDAGPPPAQPACDPRAWCGARIFRPSYGTPSRQIA